MGYLVLVVLVLAMFDGAPNKAMNVDPKRALEIVAIIGASICLTAWRCHDFGQTIWSDFWTDQIPIIGPFLAMWDLLTKPGDPDHNAYGPVPKF